MPPQAREFANSELLGDGSKFSAKIVELMQNAFSRITRDEAKLLSSQTRVYRARAGTAFITEGDPGESMALILEGEVDIIKDHQTPFPKLIASAGVGKTLGEMSLIDGEPRFASCVAVSEATFAVLSREGFLRIIDEHPRLGAKILMQLVLLLNQRLRAASAKLVQALAGANVQTSAD